jgi:hypothetical protein
LGVAFFATVPQNGAANLSGPGMALVVTTTGFYTLNPATGVLSVVSTLTDLAGTTPATVPTFPGQIMETALATSGDGTVIWGIGGAGTGTKSFISITGSPTACTPKDTLLAAAAAARERRQRRLLRHGRLDPHELGFCDAIEISQRSHLH